MDAIADDYEEISHISELVHKWASSELSVSHDEIRKTLQQLIEEGLAKAYLLSPYNPPLELPGFDNSHAENLYFWLTDAGRQAIKRD
jgi:hypothetical protein